MTVIEYLTNYIFGGVQYICAEPPQDHVSTSFLARKFRLRESLNIQCFRPNFVFEEDQSPHHPSFLDPGGGA